MSAPQIPNLNSLRRGGLRSRGRGSGQAINSPVSGGIGQASASRDDVIRRTDQDAATSRLSAVEAGYLEDPFAKLLNPEHEGTRRLPLMNRGTYVRTTGIDRIVNTFLSAQPWTKKQIISLGAGSDTRYFRLRKMQPEIELVYHELDFESNTRSKITRLQTTALRNALKVFCNLDIPSAGQISPGSAGLALAGYFIHPCDLRTLTRSPSLLTGVDTTLPTLLISECCLIYLSPTDADAVLDYFTKLFPSQTPLAIVIYEPIRPNDAFGRTMVSNLTARGIQLQTLEKYAGLKEQRERLIAHGFALLHETENSTGPRAGAEAADVDFIWRRWIDRSEKDRIERLEWMDEVEEFVLLAQHYCIAWGWRDFSGEIKWTDLPTQDDKG